MFFVACIRRHTSWPRDWSSDVCSSDLYFIFNQKSITSISKSPPCHCISIISHFVQMFLQIVTLIASFIDFVPQIIVLPSDQSFIYCISINFLHHSRSYHSSSMCVGRAFFTQILFWSWVGF